MAEIVVNAPVGGLSIVRSKARLRHDEVARAENAIFTSESIKRRLGKKGAYSPPFSSPSSSKVMGLFRFYNLATTGTVSRKFFISTDEPTKALYCANTDWSDDTATTISAFTQQVLPAVANNTLYALGYPLDGGAVAITIDQAIRNFVQAHSWVYFCPNLDVTGNDDDNNNINQPMRSQGDGKIYLHGLVPPASLAAADTSSIGIPAGSAWNVQTVLTTTAPGVARSQLARNRLLPSRFGFAYKDATSTNLNVSTYNGSAWATPDTVTGPVVPLGTTRAMDFSFDLAGFMCVLWIDSATNDLKFSFKEYPATAGTAIWRTETVTAAINVTQCSMTIDDQNIVHVVATDGLTFNYYKRDQQAAWSAAEVIVAAGVNYPVVRCRRDTYVPRVVYINAANTDVLYRQRDSGAWSAAETVKTGAAALLGSHMALDSTNIPHVSWADATNSDVLYSNRTSGAWAAASTVDNNAVPTDTFIDLNPDDLVGVSYDDYPGGFATGENRLATLEGGTWFTAAVAQPALASTCPSFLLEEDNTIYGIGSRSGVNAIFMLGSYSPYFYCLTAEYDNGILGESGPSTATSVIRRNITIEGSGGEAQDVESPIGPYNTHTLDLLDSANRYDMTDDVTRIYVYRTVRGGTATSTFYRVGSVSCTTGTQGEPDNDFIDNVSDADLVSGKILDTDRHLPPRYKTACYWKDRLVIGHLKCRDTNDSTTLDVEQDGIHKNRVRFSEAFAPDNFRTDFFQDIVPDGGSGSIQRLIVNPVTDSLYVFMESDVVALLGTALGDLRSSLSFPPRNVSGASGTPSQRSVIHHEGRIFYWTKTGIEVIEGLTARNITSDKIGVLWNLKDTGHSLYADRINMTRLNSVCAGANISPDGERILWAYSSSTSSFNDRMLVLHYGVWKKNGFRGDPPYSIYTGWSIDAMASWNGEDDRGELFGGEAVASLRAWTHRLEFDNEDDISTGAAVTTIAIQPMIIYTSLYDGGRPDVLKCWQSCRVTGKSGQASFTTSVGIVLDVDNGKGTPTVDTISWASSRVDREYRRALPRTAIGVRAGLRITVTDQVQAGEGGFPFELYGWSFTYNPQIGSRVRGSG